jgi:hypothetical protein
MRPFAVRAKTLLVRHCLDRQGLPIHARTLYVQFEYRLAAGFKEFDPELMRPGG